jgi:hypothetical protein
VMEHEAKTGQARASSRTSPARIARAGWHLDRAGDPYWGTHLAAEETPGVERPFGGLIGASRIRQAFRSRVRGGGGCECFILLRDRLHTAFSLGNAAGNDGRPGLCVVAAQETIRVISAHPATCGPACASVAGALR